MSVIGLARENADIDCDILNINENSKLKSLQPDVIVHLASIHANECQDNKQKCNKIIVEGTREVVEFANKSNSHLVFMSSSHVFDGKTSEAYSELHNPSPILNYGVAKLQAEKLIKNTHKWTILRSAMVYGTEKSGPPSGDFFNWVVKNLRNDNEIHIIMDQIYSPIYIGDLIDIIELTIQNKITGLFHTAGTDYLCRYTSSKIVKEVFELGGNISPSRRSDIGWDSRGFDYSMDISKLREHYNINPLPFKNGVMKWATKIN